MTVLRRVLAAALLIAATAVKGTAVAWAGRPSWPGMMGSTAGFRD